MPPSPCCAPPSSIPGRILRPQSDPRRFHLSGRQHGFQPVETDWVAAQLVDLAEGPSPTGYCRATDIAGPDVLTVGQLAARLREHEGRRRTRVVALPAPFGAARAFGRRQNVPPQGQARTGGRSFDDWLADQPDKVTGR